MGSMSQYRPGGGGDFMPRIFYNAKAGRLYRHERFNNNGAWESDDVEITGNAVFVADLHNIEVGYIKFGQAGVAPVFLLERLRDCQSGAKAFPDQPTEVNSEGKRAFKNGFRLHLKLGRDCGGDAREFCSTAGIVYDAVEALVDAYMAAPEREQGKLPIVKLAGTKADTNKHGTNYRPVFEIIQWTDRPEELPADGNAQGGGDSSSAPPAASNAAPPPTAAAPQSNGPTVETVPTPDNVGTQF